MKKDNNLPPYFEELLDERFKTVNDSLETLTTIAKSNQGHINTLTNSIRDTRHLVRWIIIWTAILTASHVFSLFGKPLPIDRIISIL